MPRSVLIGLLDAGRTAGWSAPVVALAVLVGLIVRQADRLADALNQWMLAWERAARKVALAGKTPQEREHGLAVLDRLSAPRPSHTCRNASGRKLTGDPTKTTRRNTTIWRD